MCPLGPLQKRGVPKGNLRIGLVSSQTNRLGGGQVLILTDSEGINGDIVVTVYVKRKKGIIGQFHRDVPYTPDPSTMLEIILFIFFFSGSFARFAGRKN